MSITDYLLMRTPEPRMGGRTRGIAGKVSGARIVLSFVGIILGIVTSFYVTGLRLAGGPAKPAVNQSQAVITTNQSVSAAQSPKAAMSSPEPKVTDDFSLRRLLRVGLISLVICGISYQGLYFSLRLYQNEPAWLIIFVAFQYGYFWQSLVKVVAG